MKKNTILILLSLSFLYVSAQNPKVNKTSNKDNNSNVMIVLDNIRKITNPNSSDDNNSTNIDKNSSTKPQKFALTLYEYSDTIPGGFRLYKEDKLTSILDSIRYSKPINTINSLSYKSNPLFLPLVFKGKKTEDSWITYPKVELNRPIKSLWGKRYNLIKIEANSTDYEINKLRNEAIEYIANNSAGLFDVMVDKLPSIKSLTTKSIARTSLKDLKVKEDELILDSTSITINKIKLKKWTKKANVLLQFTQNYVSSNWYKGGNSNLSFLNALSGELNYDNYKKLRWENKLEWRSGFNTVEGSPLRKIMINDDLLRYTTKFGVKASGNWYYSVLGVATTQLYDNYKAVNSNEYKAKLFSPVRANLNIGMDFQYKGILSLMLAPASIKYIYVSDTLNVNQNMFGIKKGENQLRQIGSSMTANLKYKITDTWDLESKFMFYTDYKKVEIDWEIINNFIINRFMTTRLMLHPRYDNTMILKPGEKAKIQFKELLSIGLSFRLI